MFGEEYWNIYATLSTNASKNKKPQTFEAKFFGKDGKKQELHSKEEVGVILSAVKNAKYIVKEIKKGEKKRDTNGISS